MARWLKGEQTVVYLIDRGQPDSFEASDLSALADAQIRRATLRLNATAISALGKGDVDGCYAAAYDAYRMAAEALLARQGLRATGGDGSHMSVEDAVSAQFAAEIPAFAKPILSGFDVRAIRHSTSTLRRRPSPNQTLNGRSRKQRRGWLV